MTPGSILVETSTVSPEASQRVARVLAMAEIHYVCAPVSGSTSIAQAGKLTVLASGDASAWAEVEPLLAHYSARRFWLGADDASRYMKPEGLSRWLRGFHILCCSPQHWFAEICLEAEWRGFGCG